MAYSAVFAVFDPRSASGSICERRAEITATERFALLQNRQILHIEDFCNECGNCATFCVHNGKPYMDKPRLCLNDHDFTTQDDNVYRVAKGLIRRREGGVEMSLAVTENGWRYEDDVLDVRLDRGFGVEGVSVKASFEGARSLIRAAEMKALYEGIENSMPWLL